MKSQQLKDLYFGVIRPLARVNHLRWAARTRRSLDNFPTPLYLNLGSGANPLPGFVNIEGGPTNRADLWLDLRNGLPFPTGSVDGIYTCHVFEHFYHSELERLLPECLRALKPGGAIRIVVPSLTNALTAYLANDHEWLGVFPHDFDSIGGRLYNYLLCDGQHRIIFDFSLMEELLLKAGFSAARQFPARESGLYDEALLARVEPPGVEYIERSLIVEGVK